VRSAGSQVDRYAARHVECDTGATVARNRIVSAPPSISLTVPLLQHSMPGRRIASSDIRVRKIAAGYALDRS
jgi:hypothetical protein